MSGNKACVALAVTTAVGVLVATSAAAVDKDQPGDTRGNVRPCSLDGVNPAYHPRIFGNAAAARSYGFVQGRDRYWRLQESCRR